MSSQLNLQNASSAQHQWLDSALGQYLQQQEQTLYDQAVVDLFGFNAVQMGCLQMDLLQNSRIPNRFKSAENTIEAQAGDLCCSDDFLPLADMSLDLLLLPHRLEFSERPHQTLREAERVMMPEGHLLISGFNPLSLWGATRIFKKLVSGEKAKPKPELQPYAQAYPWHGNFIGLNRLKDWLALLGFEVVSVEMCCYIPPFEQEVWQKRFNFMNDLGEKWFSAVGGVYFVVAKKRVVGMTPLRLDFKKAPLTSSLIARPTQRKPSQHAGLKSEHKQQNKQCE